MNVMLVWQLRLPLCWIAPLAGSKQGRGVHGARSLPRRKAEQKRAEEEEKAQLKAQPCTNADGEGFDVYQCDMDYPNLFSECREKQAECANLNKEL